MRNCFLLLPLWLVIIIPLWPQAETETGGADAPVLYIGLTLTDLYQRFGVPQSVCASRGLEVWQDDVVFVYAQGDFYIYRDRVWQVGLKGAMGIKAGDSRDMVSLIFGSKGENRGNSFFCSLNDAAWPMMLRCDFDKDDKVQVIFIYRTDF